MLITQWLGRREKRAGTSTISREGIRTGARKRVSEKKLLKQRELEQN